MKAEEELQFMMDFYPDLFPDRKHCMNHLFCVIGNGYEWENGELVNPSSPYAKRYKLMEPIIKAKGRNEEQYMDFCKQEQKIKELMGDKYKITPFNYIYNFTWCPLAETSSYLLNYPKEIKQDWLELLKECRNLMLADGVELPPE